MLIQSLDASCHHHLFTEDQACNDVDVFETTSCVFVTGSCGGSIASSVLNTNKEECSVNGAVPETFLNCCK